MKTVRLGFCVTALAGLMAAGCMLISGQFLVTFNFADHGYDPLTVTSPSTLVGVQVDLNSISEYRDHKSDIKAVADLALVGTFTNLTASPTDIEIWLVGTPSGLLTSDAAVRASGTRIWGPLHLDANGSHQVGWDASARLFGSRQALSDQIRGDGQFDLYALGSGTYSFRIDKGALIAVVNAGK